MRFKIWILFFCLITPSVYAKIYPVPFKYPELPAGEFQRQLVPHPERVALISGAGPSGLLSALVLKKTGKFDFILIVENRPEFNRYNMITFRPEVFPMLQSLNLTDLYLSKAELLQGISIFHRYS